MRQTILMMHVAGRYKTFRTSTERHKLVIVLYLKCTSGKHENYLGTFKPNAHNAQHLPTSSVTKWLYHLLNIWPFTTLIICPIAFLAKVGSNFCQILKNLPKWRNIQKIWSHCRPVSKFLSFLTVRPHLIL